MPPACPPDELLARFLSDHSSTINEDELEAHLSACDRCRVRLDQLAARSQTTPQIALHGHPPLAPEFAQRLEDSLRDSLNETDESEWAAPQIPGYDLLELIGRGGSSLVFRAHDQQLHRTVAIKILRDRASRVDRERFDREAQALAALRHPNITRANGAGESNDRYFLVMEFISGGPLSRFIGGRPQSAQSSARFVRQLASAMQAAHTAGFIHRDLKPSNVLLEEHFGRGESSGLDRFVPKVTDLGIVKDLSRDDGFTRTRDYLGTPSYMAPEQVKGSTDQVDCRTDVYALGGVLYELLTGHPPFRAGSPLDTMLLVKHEEPVAPSRFHPRLPRDLETICLKCLEKDPVRRYQSAQLLADDLDRWLQGKPISARRTRWPSKLWRWSRRNPGWAATALISFSILLALAIGGPLLARHERELRDRAIEQERQAQVERTRARDQFELASQALEGTMDQVLRSARLQESAFDDVRASLIRGALPYYEQFLQTDDSDRSVQLRQARALLQLASVHVKEQHFDKARDAYRRSLDILTKLDRDAAPDDRPTKFSLASAHMEYGRFLQVNEADLPNAERQYRLALSLHLSQLELQPNDVGRRDAAAISLSLLGTLLRPIPSRADEAEAVLLQTVRLRDRLVVDFPARTDLRHYAAMAHMNLGMLYREQNKNADEIRELQSAWDQERELTKSPSMSFEVPFYISYLQGELGIAHARAGHRDEAVALLKAAIRTAEALVVTYPAGKKYADLLANFQEALMYAEKDRPSER